VTAARERALRAALASLDGSRASSADFVRQQLRLSLVESAAAGAGTAQSELHRAALRAARQAIIAMRASDEIGDDAFHRIEEELDWLDMAAEQTGSR